MAYRLDLVESTCALFYFEVHHSERTHTLNQLGHADRPFKRAVAIYSRVAHRKSDSVAKHKHFQKWEQQASCRGNFGTSAETNSKKDSVASLVLIMADRHWHSWQLAVQKMKGDEGLTRGLGQSTQELGFEGGAHETFFFIKKIFGPT